MCSSPHINQNIYVCGSARMHFLACVKTFVVRDQRIWKLISSHKTLQWKMHQTLQWKISKLAM